MTSNHLPIQSHQTAAGQIAEHLSTPPSLSRVPLLRQRISKERQQLQQTLAQRAKEQVDLVKQGLLGLRDSRQQLESLREGLKEVEHQMGDPRSTVPGFGKLVQVSIVHRRLTSTLDMVNSLRSMYSRLEHLEGLLQQDRQDPLGDNPNLLPIHYHLAELETFRNETLAQANKSALTKQRAEETHKVLSSYFSRLGETIEAFEAHYFRLARELVQLARNGHASVAVKVSKVAEVEGQRDQRAIAIRMVKKSGNLDVASRFRSLHADARTIKHYRAKVLEQIREGCRTEIEKSYRRAGEDGVRWLDELEWIYDDLDLVQEKLVDKFPQDWKIHQVYVKAYHKALYDFLSNYVKTTPDAGTLLRLSQFTKEYRQTMTKELSIDPTWLEPPLLDGKESTLMDSYLELISSRMDEWTSNLMKTELEEFTLRQDPPEIDHDGYYGMQGAIILFQMLNQQIDLALDSNQAAVLSRVVDEAHRVMRGVQSKWIKTLDSEYKKQTQASESGGTSTLPGGLVEYVMALANDQIKSADFTEALNTRLEPLVSTKYKQPIADKLNDAMDGYLDVAKRCVQVLIDVVFHDLRPATKNLLNPSVWYSATDETDPMGQIVETLKDYMVEDYQTHLNPNLFDLLIEDLLDTFLITYLVSVKKASKIKMPKAVERMRSDIDKATEFFSLYKNKKELEGYFDVLESVLTLLSASKMMVFLDYWPFRRKYGPQLVFMESLMKARDDLDKSSVNEIMESVKRKVKETKVVGEGMEEAPSIFDRMPAK